MGIKEINMSIDALSEYETLHLKGIYEFCVDSAKSILLGGRVSSSLIVINKKNIIIDGTEAIIRLNLNGSSKNIDLIFLTALTQNVILRNINIEINVIDNCKGIINAISNCGRKNKIKDGKISILGNCRFNATAISNYAKENTHMDTLADCLSVENSYIDVVSEGEGIDTSNLLFGIKNFNANSICISNNYIFTKNKGIDDRHKAIAIYNNGRYARISNNNIKANAAQNSGLDENTAHALAVVDEGLYTLISDNNIIGEWGCNCIGLRLKGAFSKITGNKILATHALYGTSMDMEVDRAIVSNNIIFSTSKNPKAINIKNSKHLSILGNLIQAIIPTGGFANGFGIIADNVVDSIIKDNQILNTISCGIVMSKCANLECRENLLMTEFEKETYIQTAIDNDFINNLINSEVGVE